MPLKSITIPWLFAIWGIDILGPFPLAIGQQKYLIVAVDYFAKWIEAEPLSTITEKQVEDFLWKSIICRFGIPHTIITDNVMQFQKRFNEFCEDFHITLA
ncbi:hypothetical protein V6N12_046555 [Hibiscus sabdariffa]|uniref:Integrase catalytic domain-containing protein n=1 Tax=Hibiscus sabdariffa TaxID=183260 RepID=A0ABR2DJ03_9ROSI